MTDPTAPVPQRPPVQPPVAGPPPVAGSPPVAGPPGPPAVAPGARQGWFGQATSTSGGRIAVVAAAVFGTLLLMASVGLVAALVVGGGPGRDDERVMMSERSGPGNGKGMGQGLGLQKDKARGNGQGNNGNGQGNNGNGQGNNGNGQGMGRLAPGMDAVLHGEFTTNVTGTPTVMVVQSGQVTAYTAGTSLTVKSADGFEATYVLDATVATMRGADELAVGVPVNVVAAKEGLKVTRLAVG
jgi:hypothetical protein